MKKRLLGLVATAGLLGALVSPAGAVDSTQLFAEPTRTWIVTLAPDVSLGAYTQAAARQSGEVGHIYRHVLNGFSFSGSQEAASWLLDMPGVVSVEPSLVRNLAIEPAKDPMPLPDLTPSDDGGELNSAIASETASRGFSRIDGSDALQAGFVGVTPTGIPVRVAVLDTGIDTDHPDLAPVYDPVESKDCVDPNTTPEDDHGHGTHVAGIGVSANQGSGVIGIASEASLVVVKVANAAGQIADAWAICGFDHVAALAADGIPTVANLSFGGPSVEGPGCASSAYHQAVCGMTDAGVVVVAAAGNDTLDAASFYPAAYDETIAVSAFTDLDGAATSIGCGYWFRGGTVPIGFHCDETLAFFTNHGSVIDVTAPGLDILSTAIGGGTEYRSGTSMAAPAATGVAALVLGANPTMDRDEVLSVLLETGECPDGSISTTGDCLTHGGWLMTDQALETAVPDPDGVPEPLVNAFRAAQLAASLYVPPPNSPPVVAASLRNASGIPSGQFLAGETVTASVQFSDNDRGDTHDVSITWGDGTSESWRLSVGQRTTTRTHVYARSDGASVAAERTYTVAVEVFDGEETGSWTTDITVVDPPTDIIVLGGSSAVSDTVVGQLAACTTGSVYRIAGANRYATAAAISAATFPGGADVVYIATGEAFPDALAGGPAAGAVGGPVLLVQSDSLPGATATELARLKPDRIVILGGTGVVSPAVAGFLDGFAPTVERLAGANRYTTAVEVSENSFAVGAGPAYVATGENFPDALGGGPVAIVNGGPVLLVPRDSLPGPVAAELARLHPAAIRILGGLGAVSDAVELMLRGYGPTIRIAGATRYHTAVAVAQSEFAAGVAKIFIATGENFPDALAGVPAAGLAKGPILLVQPDSIPTVTKSEIGRLTGQVCS